jgi:protein TonB
MFESSLMESGGQLKTKTGRWMFLTGTINLSILAILILIPLLYPEALPRTALTALLTAPPPPPPPPPPPAPQQKAATVKLVSEIDSGLHAPTKIPKDIKMVKEEAAPSSGAGVVGMTGGMPGGQAGGVAGSIFSGMTRPVVPRVVAKPTGPVHLSSGVVAGMIISKPEPVYPAIAKAAHVQGAVILHAIISKQGTIEDLSVISGNGMLVNAARDAVSRWRYRPYLLNGEPTEVETSITVNFTFTGG